MRRHGYSLYSPTHGIRVRLLAILNVPVRRPKAFVNRPVRKWYREWSRKLESYKIMQSGGYAGTAYLGGPNLERLNSNYSWIF